MHWSTFKYRRDIGKATSRQHRSTAFPGAAVGTWRARGRPARRFVLEGEKGKQAVRLAQAPIACPPDFAPPGLDGFGVDPAVGLPDLVARTF